MKRDNTATRLKYLMETRKIRQIDILNLTMPFCEKYQIKMNKSDISQYVSGKVEPNQNKLAILSMALGVSESWLAGYDVPMERPEFSKDIKQTSSSQDMDTKEFSVQDPSHRFLHAKLQKSFGQLTDKNRQRVIDYSEKLLELQQMEENILPVAAHGYENATPEDMAYDNAIMDDENF